MKLEELRPLYHTLSPDEQVAVVRQYRDLRQQDITTYKETKKRTGGKKAATTPQFTDEEKAVMKLLGIKPAALASMKMIEEPDEPEEIDDADGNEDRLFEDA